MSESRLLQKSTSGGSGIVASSRLAAISGERAAENLHGEISRTFSIVSDWPMASRIWPASDSLILFSSKPLMTGFTPRTVFPILLAFLISKQVIYVLPISVPVAAMKVSAIKQFHILFLPRILNQRGGQYLRFYEKH